MKTKEYEKKMMLTEREYRFLIRLFENSIVIFKAISANADGYLPVIGLIRGEESTAFSTLFVFLARYLRATAPPIECA